MDAGKSHACQRRIEAAGIALGMEDGGDAGCGGGLDKLLIARHQVLEGKKRVDLGAGHEELVADHDGVRALVACVGDGLNHPLGALPAQHRRIALGSLHRHRPAALVRQHREGRRHRDKGGDAALLKAVLGVGLRKLLAIDEEARGGERLLDQLGTLGKHPRKPKPLLHERAHRHPSSLVGDRNPMMLPA